MPPLPALAAAEACEQLPASHQGSTSPPDYLPFACPGNDAASAGQQECGPSADWVAALLEKAAPTWTSLPSGPPDYTAGGAAAWAGYTLAHAGRSGPRWVVLDGPLGTRRAGAGR